MAKESNSSRIPRLDGISRIPLPGSLRPPSATNGRSSQILRPPNAVAFAHQRPASLSGLRPHIAQSNLLKRSASGDRISNAVSFVSKKTTAAVQKFMGSSKLEKVTAVNPLKAFVRKTTESTAVNTTQVFSGNDRKLPTMVSSTPCPTLTRSETFVRGDSQLDMLGISQDSMVQLTPAPATVTKLPSETTRLLGKDSRQALYTTQNFDVTHTVPSMSATITVEKEGVDENPLLRTITLDSTHTGFGQTIEVTNGGEQVLGNTMTISDADSRTTERVSLSTTQQRNVVNLTKTFNTTQLLGKTMHIVAANEHALGSTMTIGKSVKQDGAEECVSPVTNATYSNPGSTENLQMLEDVTIPPEFDADDTIKPPADLLDKTCQNFFEISQQNIDETLVVLPPDKANMILPLNSTMNTERLLDLTGNLHSPDRQMHLLNLTKDYLEGTPNQKNTTQLLYMTQISCSATTTPDTNPKLCKAVGGHAYQHTPLPAHLMSPSLSPLLKGAQSDLVLPTRTPDEEMLGEPMDVDTTLTSMGARTDEFLSQLPHRQLDGLAAKSLQDVNNPNGKQKSRFSFGLDLTESTLDCSIELIDVSLSSTALSQPNTSGVQMAGMFQSSSTQQLHQQLLKKQNSFDFDESLGILTPDQMKEFLDSTTTNTNNLDLPLALNVSNNNKIVFHQMRIDQTPSPEELPLDPVEVKTDISDMVQAQQPQQQAGSFTMSQQRQYMQQQQHQQHNLHSSSTSTEPVSAHTDMELSKGDQMTKSNVSKISTSFITSVTSVTSLDTGYQGDGEMSRPASRGAGDHSPSNGPAVRKGGHVSRQPSFNQQQQLPPIRRQDPMTDSDFFTESDADDIFHRGDRRAQVIDGQLYGPMLQPTASVFISEDPQMEDSCMESSGIFTDVENRCEEDLAQMRRQDTQDAVDLSPDAEVDGDDSTETVKSNRDRTAGRCGKQNSYDMVTSAHGGSTTSEGHNLNSNNGNGSQTSSTIQSSLSTDRLSPATLSNRTSYCSVDGSAVNMDYKSFSSLEEAFDECAAAAGDFVAGKCTRRVKSSSGTTGSTTSCCGERELYDDRALSGVTAAAAAAVAAAGSVQKVSSPRKHASLSSLSNANGVLYTSDVKSETSSPLIFKNVNVNVNATTGTVRSGAGVGSGSGTGSQVSLSDSVKSAAPTATINGGKCARPTATAGTTPQKTSPKLRAQKLTPKIAVNAINTTAGGGGHATRKSHPSPNKWDAVMNKIASNKVHAKKNYSDVKSKVYTSRLTGVAGSGGRGDGAATPGSPCTTTSSSPSVRRSPSNGPMMSPKVLNATRKTLPTDAALNAVGLSPHTTLLLPSSGNGRSYSKDSQKSSQSDLSLASAGGVCNGGGSGVVSGSASPKLLAKTPLRAAKKRDVRNLSISPTDLGPPPKTQQTANGTSARPKPSAAILTQKRFTPTNTNSSSIAQSATPSTTSSAANTPTGSGGGSVKSTPIVKKHPIGTRRFDVGKTLPAKSPLKDHNRFIDTQQSSISKNGSKPETPTDFNDITNNGGSAIGGGSGVAIHHNNNSSNNKNNNLARTSVSPILGVPRGGSVGGSVVGSGGGHGKKLINNESNGGVMLLDKKTPSKVQTTRKLLFQRNAAQQQQQQQQQHQHQQQQQLHKQHSIEDSPQTPTSGEYLDASELQRLKLLNRHSCNGRLDYESLERHLQQAELIKQQQDKGVEALGVMLQYLVYDLDAFSCPSAKSESAKAKESLSKTLNLLEEAKSACTELQDQLCDKEAYYTQREEELQALHRCELEKAKSNVSEIQMLAKEKISAVETKLAAKDAENKRALDCYRLEMDNKCAQKQEQLAMAESRERALKERLSLLESSEKALREQATEAEQSYGARLQAAAAREHELNERVKVLSRELDQLRDAKEHRERELRDKLNLSQDEISVLRSSHRSSLNESLDRSTSPRNSSNAMSQEVSRLQHESESLRCVLELKQKEISKLSKQNEELMRDATERASLQAKISLLESRNELLQSEIIIKAEKEKEFQRQMEDMQKSYNHESTKRTRLSYDNEALQWQLKQRSEQLHIVEAKLQELSANEHQLGSTMNSSNLSFVNRLSQNGSSMVDECSPPTSPVVKGVIKKPDSVSWVLEMDDETPEAAATKMVKRAGSFRSVERSPSIRRQLSVSASAASSTNTINGSSVGPNPLSQSMSATSVIRQHSNDVGAEFSNRSHLRIRSKSVSVKCSDPVASSAKNDKKLSRQHSSGNSRKNELVVSTWKEPISASSPYSAMRPRPSARCHDATASCQDALLLRRPSSSSSTSRKLITCDTSTLNSGEKLEMRSLPTHPSVHDLKMLKKCQEIQESAGEAMLSGTNSEDEGCSASSDEIISSASTSSRTTGSTSSLNHIQNPHMSLEDVLQIEKINSLNGTPMEMSWSDDAEVFTNTSTV